MPVLDLFHAYTFGSALWYTLRAGCRLYDPVMVIGWFRPPQDSLLQPNDLEKYNVRTDAWGLVTIALMLLFVSGAVPLPAFLSSSKAEQKDSLAKQPYAKAAILADVFHHITTGLGAWDHYSKETHYNSSMAVGVWGCTGLALLGIATLLAPPSLSGLGIEGQRRSKKIA